MYKIATRYPVEITKNGTQVVVLASTHLEISNMVDRYQSKPVDISFWKGDTASNFVLEITRYYNSAYYNSAKIVDGMHMWDTLKGEILEQDFKDLCEDTLTKLKLGCACLVVNDTKLTYELIKTLIEDF